MDKQSGGLLSGYIPEQELAAQLGRNPRTLWRWRKLRIGPPFVMVGEVPYYSVEAARQWLAAGGTCMRTPAGSSRLRRAS